MLVKPNIWLNDIDISTIKIIDMKLGNVHRYYRLGVI